MDQERSISVGQCSNLAQLSCWSHDDDALWTKKPFLSQTIMVTGAAKVVTIRPSCLKTFKHTLNTFNICTYCTVASTFRAAECLLYVSLRLCACFYSTAGLSQTCFMNL